MRFVRKGKTVNVNRLKTSGSIFFDGASPEVGLDVLEKLGRRADERRQVDAFASETSAAERRQDLVRKHLQHQLLVGPAEKRSS